MAEEPNAASAAAERAAFEARALSLVGLRLAAVRYLEFQYSEPPEPAFRGPEFDSLDWGLEVVGDDGRVVGFGWSSEFEHFNVAILEDGLGIEATDRTMIWDVSADSRWSAFLGRRVTGVRIQWIEDEETWVEMRGLLARVPLAVLRPSILSAMTRAVGEAAPKAGRPWPGARGWLGHHALNLASWAARARGNVELRRRSFPLSVELELEGRHVWIGAVEPSEDGDHWTAANHISVAFDEDAARELGLALPEQPPESKGPGRE